MYSDGWGPTLSDIASWVSRGGPMKVRRAPSVGLNSSLSREVRRVSLPPFFLYIFFFQLVVGIPCTSVRFVFARTGLEPTPRPQFTFTLIPTRGKLWANGFFFSSNFCFSFSSSWDLSPTILCYVYLWRGNISIYRVLSLLHPIYGYAELGFQMLLFLPLGPREFSEKWIIKTLWNFNSENKWLVATFCFLHWLNQLAPFDLLFKTCVW